MASYRLLDELPDTRKRKPPWSPLGLFFLTWVYLPLAVPFWVINWARLGHGERRLVCVLAAILAFALPIAVAVGFELNRDTARLGGTVAKFAFAYFQLFGQRPLYDAHLNRGGEKAPAWQIWLAVLAGVLIPLALASLRK